MIGHKHRLIENGTMLLCRASGCPTHGKSFLLAGGSGDPCGWEDEPLTRISKLIAEGVNANLKVKELEGTVKELESKVNQLQKQIDELRRILAKGGVIVPRYGC